MTDDLPAINVLSQRFVEATKQLSRGTHGGNDIAIISQSNPIREQGAKVLRMYEAELSKAANDLDVKRSMAQHLFRMGLMYYDTFSPSLLSIDTSESLRKPAIEHAEHACYNLLSSFHLYPNSNSAFVLADTFRMVRFYGTAIYWLQQAENISATFDDSDSITQAKASRLELQADGKVADPPLSRKIPFPTANTAGLIVANQPIQSEDADRGALGFLWEVILARLKINTGTSQGEPESATRTGWRAFLFGREPWK